MTNIRTKTNKSDVRLHIKKAYQIMDEHLPDNYVAAVLAKLPKNSNAKPGIIRNLRIADPEKVTDRNLYLINALVEVALEHKAMTEKLIKITN